MKHKGVLSNLNWAINAQNSVKLAIIDCDKTIKKSPYFKGSLRLLKEVDVNNED